jgi:dTDP-4-dehydrorhamnose reductase
MATADVICIVGAKGMLGQELVRACRGRGIPRGAVVYAIDREEIDIGDARNTSEVIRRLRPTLLINAAAYTDVDGCETHQDLAMAVNALGPANLAHVCRMIECRLVHVSTDYVFDGTKRTPYLPADPMNPQGVYGKTKAEGEQRVRQVLKDHVVVRTSWLYAAHSKNFVRTILKAAQERDLLQVVGDQIGCPTYAPDLAKVLVSLGRSRLTGTYHFCNAGFCSWYEFARRIVQLGGLDTSVRPTTTELLGRPAPRPAYSVLSLEKIKTDLGITPRCWCEALEECITKLRREEDLRSRRTEPSPAESRDPARDHPWPDSGDQTARGDLCESQ